MCLQDELMYMLRKLLLNIGDLPAQTSHILFNYLVLQKKICFVLLLTILTISFVRMIKNVVSVRNCWQFVVFLAKSSFLMCPNYFIQYFLILIFF